MVVIDLDRFKQVNNFVGIAVGNSILLETLARRLGRLLKPQDTLARLTGDPFFLILLSERDPTKLIAFARDVSERTLRAPITFNDREIFLTASIGLALGDSKPNRTEEVLKDAELAMYHAKRIGGDRIELFKPAMRARKTDRLTLESELQAQALERDEITILYQPIVRLEDRSVAGFEALARWDHPKLGRMSNAASTNGARTSGYAHRSADTADTLKTIRAVTLTPAARKVTAHRISAASRSHGLSSGAPTASGSRPACGGGRTIQIEMKKSAIEATNNHTAMAGTIARALLSHDEARQREFRVRIDPLLAATEPDGGPFLQHLPWLVLVRALGPDRFAVTQVELHRHCGNGDPLGSHADEMHLDTPLDGVPGRAVA